jgi:nucleoid-associated protein YgaU
MSRTVLVLVAVGAVIIAVALGVAWKGKVAEKAALVAVAPAPAQAVAATPQAVAAIAPAESRPAPPAESKPQAVAAAVSPSQVAAPPAPSAPAASAPGAPSPPAAVMAPSFDVARIGVDGRAVIAGRAAPGARIVLLNGNKEIARSVADARGEWVILAQDPPLAAGQHELRAVQHIEGRAPVTSEQVVIAVVPAPPAAEARSRPAAGAPAPARSIALPSAAEPPPVKREEALVLIAPPSGAATLIQSPSPAGVPRSADLQISTMDYDQRGQTTITGQATPGATVRAYVDDKVVAEGQAGPDGRWKIAPDGPVESGPHTLRLDRLAQDGRPTARLEMPFERVAAPAGSGDTRRLHVVRGDNLWNIARAHYGDGWRYTLIFEANKDQIRDPHRIYPGQTFSLPNKVN